MIKKRSIALIIPTRNEADCIQQVVTDFSLLKRHHTPLLNEIVVVDNNSTDDTAAIARSAGATVITEQRPGYGQACISGLDYLAQRPEGPPSIVVFVDGDGSNYAPNLLPLLAPFDNKDASIEFTLGSRTQLAEPGALTPQQQFGNRLACRLMRWCFNAHYTDLGPFRAIRWEALQQLEMRDTTYGWTIEMQIKAAKLCLSTLEVNVQYRPRQGGASKVSGTLKGVVGAAISILSTIFKHR